MNYRHDRLEQVAAVALHGGGRAEPERRRRGCGLLGEVAAARAAQVELPGLLLLVFQLRQQPQQRGAADDDAVRGHAKGRRRRARREQHVLGVEPKAEAARRVVASKEEQRKRDRFGVAVRQPRAVDNLARRVGPLALRREHDRRADPERPQRRRRQEQLAHHVRVHREHDRLAARNAALAVRHPPLHLEVRFAVRHCPGPPGPRDARPPVGPEGREVDRDDLILGAGAVNLDAERARRVGKGAHALREGLGKQRVVPRLVARREHGPRQAHRRGHRPAVAGPGRVRLGAALEQAVIHQDVVGHLAAAVRGHLRRRRQGRSLRPDGRPHAVVERGRVERKQDVEGRRGRQVGGGKLVGPERDWELGLLRHRLAEHRGHVHVQVRRVAGRSVHQGTPPRQRLLPHCGRNTEPHGRGRSRARAAVGGGGAKEAPYLGLPRGQSLAPGP